MSAVAVAEGIGGVIPRQDPRLPAKMPHLVGAMNLEGPRGLCFHRSVGLVLDVRPPPAIQLVIGRVREATAEEQARIGPDASPTPFIHAWCEIGGEVFAPTLIEVMGGLLPVNKPMYYHRNGIRELARLSRGDVKRLDRLHGYSAHLRKFKPLKDGATFGGSLLSAAGVPWRDNGLGGVEAID